MKIYRISSLYHYLGQCDRLRSGNSCNEQKWQLMIKNSKKVSIEEFKGNCDYMAILDDDESMEDFISSDSDSYFAKSMWGETPCYYVMTCGFEFIFVL